MDHLHQKWTTRAFIVPNLLFIKTFVIGRGDVTSLQVAFVKSSENAGETNF
jgi:hypothetical protein